MRLALAVGDERLAERLMTLLSGIEGLEIVRSRAEADCVISGVSTAPIGRDPVELASETGELTRRELEVLALLAEGASNKVIARRLGISTHTVKFHVASLIDKLDAVGRTDAVTHAAKLGILVL